eukprot:2158000-Amphidinium_carterae.1
MVLHESVQSRIEGGQVVEVAHGLLSGFFAIVPIPSCKTQQVPIEQFWMAGHRTWFCNCPRFQGGGPEVGVSLNTVRTGHLPWQFRYSCKRDCLF